MTCDQTTGVQGSLVVTRDVGEGRAESLLGVASVLGDQGCGCLFEEREHGIVDLLKVGADVHSAGLDDVLGLRHTDSLELDSSLLLNLLNEHLGLTSVEGDTGSTGTGSGCTTRPMDVGLGLLRGLDLDDQVDVGDVEASGSDISGDEHSEFAFLEALHRDLTLVLGDVTMHDLDVLLDLVGEQEGVGIGLGLGEDDHLASLAVDNEDVSEGRESILVGALNGQVRHVTSRLVLQLHGQVDDTYTLLHMGCGNVSDPPRDGG